MAGNVTNGLSSEIRDLENKIAQLSVGSMERMFAELRLDMKKDNLKMMSKIDDISKNLQQDVKTSSENQR